MTRFTVRLPQPPGALDRNGRRHYQVVNRLEREYRELAALLIRQALDEQLGPGERLDWDAYVSCTELWISKGARRPDMDQVAARCKPYLDGAQDAGVVTNDKVIKPLTQDERQARPGESPCVELTFTKRDPSEEELWPPAELVTDASAPKRPALRKRTKP